LRCLSGEFSERYWDDMKVVNGFAVFSQAVNILIFVYFIIVLLKLNVLDAWGLFISAFGILTSLASSIVSVLMED